MRERQTTPRGARLFRHVASATSSTSPSPPLKSGLRRRISRASADPRAPSMAADLQSFLSKASSSNPNLLTAVVPLMKLLTLTLIGLLLSRAQIVPRATFRLLSKLVFVLFLPCLIFVHLGQSITLTSAIHWWFIPINVLLSTAAGCALGYLVALICRPPPEFFRFTVVMTGLGNTGNLPIAIVGSVCHTAGNPFQSDCYVSGTAYVSFAQWMAVLLVYTFVYHMMEPPQEISDNQIDEIVEIGSSSFSRPLLHEAEWPGIVEKETVHCKTPFIARVFAGISSQSVLPQEIDLEDEQAEIDSPKSIRCLAEPRVVRRMRTVAEQTPIRHILQPPTIASLLAIAAGMTPARKFLFEEGAQLGFLTDSLDILGGAMVPSVMLMLGGMIAEGPRRSSELGLRTTVGIVVARLLVLPLLGIGFVAMADELGLLVEDDAMYRFVLLLQYTTPSAILLGAIASLRGYAVAEASALLFWQHIFAVFSLSIYIAVYFKILSYV